MTGRTKLENFFVRTSIFSFTVRLVRLTQKSHSSSNFSQFCASLGTPFLVVFFVLIIPTVTHAQVLLSEIAWMGTDDDANNEWIEIYNFSNSPTDLAGWTLTTESGSINIALTGTLQPHQVVVLERTDDTTLPTVAAFLTYTGALSNDGETLFIKDQHGTISDQASGGSGWESVGGINVKPKFTPQRTRTGTWVVGVPTPGAENITQNGTHQSSETDTDTDTTNDTQTAESTHTSGRTSGRGGGSSRKSAGSEDNIPPKLVLSFDAPTVAYVNQPVSFTARPSGLGTTLTSSLVYTWNFGDTFTDTGREATHRFVHPGVYTVVLEGRFAKQYAMVRHDIEVLPTALSLERKDDGTLVIHNGSTEEVDLGGFIVHSGIKKFIFPPHTYLRAEGALTVPRAQFEVQEGAMATLQDTARVAVASLSVRPHGYAETVRRTIPQSSVAAAPAYIPETVEVVPLDAPSTEEMVIRIGSEEDTSESPGFFRRILMRMGGLFGF